MEKRKRLLKDEDFGIIFSNINHGVGTDRQKKYQSRYRNRDMAIIIVLASTGIRSDALVSIDIEDVDLQNRTIKVTSKGDKTRVKTLTDEACYYLSKYMDERLKINSEDNALFISNRNKRITNKTIRNIVNRFSEGIDKRITPHVFRKTFGTRVYNHTGDIALVADLLDHAIIDTTRRSYVIVDTQRKKNAVESTNLFGQLNTK